MTKEKTKHNIRLTAAEMGMLWNHYMTASMAICTTKYFLEKVEDEEVEPIVQYALENSKKQLQTVKDIFKHENHPIPMGFTDDDVNPEAPRLMSDAFVLYYLKFMGTIELATASVSISAVARSDVSDFFHEVLASAASLHRKATDLMLQKGVYIRPPYIPTPVRVDFVKEQNFLTGFFGERHPLTSIEISHLFSNVITNAIGKVFMMAFAQVTRSPDIREYFIRGKRIANKHMEVFSSILKEEDLPAPMSWDSHVMDTKTAPFSEKLMLFHTTTLTSTGLGNYGTAIAGSQRRDLATHYFRLAQEVALYAEDGAKLLINKNWMEQPPQTPDRGALMRGQ
ncbi:DUF3231 family protein [Caldalkalibacillus salinus]|uniref:DUF3231 family protein n=1 Tax=Caldalkalibacillus salinus TaxID=2803787 RepID=UPI001921372A|nr:DUF3231 family protein [Caldalkalibacillus salinus]